MSNNKSLYSEKAPEAIGPYSQAIKAGNTIYLSGNLGWNRENEAFEGEDTASQTRRALMNIQAILETEGYSMNDIVKTSVFLADMNDFTPMNEVYASFFQEPYPARSAVQVAKLPKNAKVEIEAIAAR